MAREQDEAVLGLVMLYHFEADAEECAILLGIASPV